jgi:hypothetical protein
MPAQHDLSRAHPVLGGDLGQHRVTQVGARERAVALQHHPALAVLDQPGAVIEHRHPGDLVAVSMWR